MNLKQSQLEGPRLPAVPSGLDFSRVKKKTEPLLGRFIDLKERHSNDVILSIPWQVVP